MKTKIIQNIKSIILALILVVGVSYVSAASVWSNPTSIAPGNNVDTPLNVSGAGQVKAGGLTLNTSGAVNGLIVKYGNVSIGTLKNCDNLATDKSGKLYCNQYTPCPSIYVHEADLGVTMNWNDATTSCNSAAGRLPTDEEWACMVTNKTYYNILFNTYDKNYWSSTSYGTTSAHTRNLNSYKDALKTQIYYVRCVED